MPPNQDWTSNGKRVDKSTPTTNCVLLAQEELRIDLAHDATVGQRSRNSKFSTHHQDQSMESSSNEGRGVHLHTLVDRDAEALQERG